MSSRRRQRAAWLAIGALAGALAVSAGSADAAVAAPSSYRPGVVLLGFEPGVAAARRHAIVTSSPLVRRGRTLVSAARLAAAGGRMGAVGPLERLRVEPGREARVVRDLGARDGVRFAELDYLLHANAVPDDPAFGLQWGFLNTGQTVNGIAGLAGADERAVAAWNYEAGARSVVVGVVDSGVDYTHPDLAANVWTNPGAVGGCPAGTHGRDVRAGTCDPMDDETVFGGHGTHVAGIVGAVGDNGVGVAGVNWRTTILPVKWLDWEGNGSTAQLISALDWLLAAQAGGVNVRVVNDSATFIGTAFSQALSDEIDLLGANDILFVTAAGNTGDDNDDPALRRYPCGYGRPSEICVTASDQRDRLPAWANYGASTVDLAAPGVNVYSTLRDGSYGYVSGGSMASPQVAGAAALILSRARRSVASLKAAILDSVTARPALTGRVETGGRLNICAALPNCGPSIAIDASPPRYTSSSTAAFAFSSDDPQALIRCRLASEAHYSTCGPSRTYEGLSEDDRTLRVFAVDGGNRSAIKSWTWTVDRTAPLASIDSGPPPTTSDASATLAFSAIEASPNPRFRCRLDEGQFASCHSPVGYSGLAEGGHRFAVRATDRAGNVSAGAVRTWTVTP